MYDEATLKRYKDQHEIVMSCPRINDSLVELKTLMKKFETSGNEEEIFEKTAEYSI